MTLGFSGLPVIAQISDARHKLFNDSHNWQTNDPITAKQVAAWMGHKAMTVISFPANVIEEGVCTAGFIVAACTLGALKVAIFAVTLGNIKLHFPTGCVWFGERALHGAFDIAVNSGELIYDAGNALYQGYRLTRWVAGQLHLENLFNKIFHQLGRIFNFVGERITKGFDKAVKVEGDAQYSVPYPLNRLDDLTNAHRIDLNLVERSLDDIFKHNVLSVFNIPLNAVTAVGAAGLSVAWSTIFTAKVILYATTNIDIPIPTFAEQSIKTTAVTAANTIIDISNDVADAFVLIYKISNAIGLNKVMVTAMRVVSYIPEAIFG